jgi:hypothetical protein
MKLLVPKKASLSFQEKAKALQKRVKFNSPAKAAPNHQAWIFKVD